MGFAPRASVPYNTFFVTWAIMIIGIDLGTTNSLVGYLSDARPKLIPAPMKHCTRPNPLLTPAIVVLSCPVKP